MDDLRIGAGLVIPAGELDERFSTSGGPGGQHANRAATKVTLSFDVAASPSLDERQKARLLDRLGSRLSDGVLSVSSEASRSQWRNRHLARARMVEMISAGLRPDPAPRKPTRPTRASRRRRLEAKRARGRLKRLRRRPDEE
jgi:ribosome-associated protein